MKKSLASALFSKVRHSIICLMFSSPDISLHLREIGRLTNLSAATVRLELDSLASAGVLTDERRGNQRFFMANRNCPLFDELCGIARKTFRIADRSFLEKMALKYIWWLSPDDALEFPQKVIAQVMNIGTFEDVSDIENVLGNEFLKDAITHAQPGQFDKRSWSYWHCKLGLSDVDSEPPLPVRSFS